MFSQISMHIKTNSKLKIKKQNTSPSLKTEHITKDLGVIMDEKLILRNILQQK
jgi:hypothetical protein